MPLLTLSMRLITIVLIIVCLVAFGVLFLLLIRWQSRIPKVIWTFWDSDELPPFIMYCISTWSKHNPDHEIRVVTPTNIHLYLPGLDINKQFKHADSAARISDFVRLHLLAKYGGIWSDASIIHNRPLTWLHRITRGKEFFGYYLESFTSRSEYPVLESWFFACTPHSGFVQKWRDTFLHMNDFDTVEDYVSALQSVGTDVQKIDGTTYLAIHVAAQYVMQILKYPMSHLAFLKAEDGPYAYLVRNNWDSEKAASEIIAGKVSDDLVKVRGSERKALERHT